MHAAVLLYWFSIQKRPAPGFADAHDAHSNATAITARAPAPDVHRTYCDLRVA